MKSNNKYIIIGLVLAIVGLMFYQGMQVSRLEEKNLELSAYIDTQNQQLENLKNQISDLKAQESQNNEPDQSQRPWFWEALDYPKSPEALIGSLKGQNQLIPFDGVLGGTPFFVLEEAEILDQTYVYVPIEDGHVMGGMILKYTFLGESQIEWTVVDGWWSQDEG